MQKRNIANLLMLSRCAHDLSVSNAVLYALLNAPEHLRFQLSKRPTTVICMR